MATTAKVDTSNAVEAEDSHENPLVALVAEGQSIWLDFITRDLVRGGELKRLIEDDGLRGMTSNPTIFQKAMAEGNAYDDQLRELVEGGKDAKAIFEALMVTDIQEACDLFRPVYEETDGLDGMVSVEVSPGLARDTAGTLAEARRLWRAVDRPNVMVKVPGTAEGAPAIEQLLGEGVNVNVTLLFSLKNHERVMWNYIAALERRAAAGEPFNRIASVASFFISRVDTLVDKKLEEQIAAAEGKPAEQERLRGLLGKAAIANAKLAYARFGEIFHGAEGARFAKLKARGANVQRPLWGSTSTKNPDYRDVLYIETLIGPDTVNTVPKPTLEAFMDHGEVRRTVDEGVDEARATLAALEELGIGYDAVTEQLEDEGIALFAKSYDELIAGIEEKAEAMRRE
jgi:transaldolase